MKVLSKEEEEAHYNVVLKGGAIGGSLGFAIGLGGVLAASRRYPAFRGLTLPFRTFLVTSSSTFGAIVNADRASTRFQRAQDPMNDYQDASQRARDMMRENESSYQRFMEFGREHRYTIVFGSWIASMGIALALVGRAPISTAQKLVQARVYAQGLTLAVLIVSAAFETSDAKKGKGRWETVMVLDPNDPNHKHMIEKKVHKEEYEGQDLWMDMVDAEERRMKSKKGQKSSPQKQKTEKSPKENNQSQKEDEEKEQAEEKSKEKSEDKSQDKSEGKSKQDKKSDDKAGAKPQIEKA